MNNVLKNTKEEFERVIAFVEKSSAVNKLFSLNKNHTRNNVGLLNNINIEFYNSTLYIELKKGIASHYLVVGLYGKGNDFTTLMTDGHVKYIFDEENWVECDDSLTSKKDKKYASQELVALWIKKLESIGKGWNNNKN